VEARLWSPHFVNIARLRKQQLRFADTPQATNWMIGLLQRKTDEQIVHLHKLSRTRPALKKPTEDAINKINAISTKLSENLDYSITEVRNTLMGLEGNISKHYFKVLNLHLPDDFQFARRSRRPAADYFNAALNYLYGMTYSVVESGVLTKGLDPAIGVLHVDQYRAPTLVFDLIEPMRPVVDTLLLDLIKIQQLQPQHFTQKDKGYWVATPGKRVLIKAYNQHLHQRIKLNTKVRRFKDHIFEESNALAHLIMNDK